MSNLWKSLKEWAGVSKPTEIEMKRSQYSLVATGDLTDDTLQLWMALPEEVKFDPALEPFRSLYEKEHGAVKEEHVAEKQKPKTKIPLVKSAPVLGNLHVIRQESDGQISTEEEPQNGLREYEVEEKVINTSPKKKTKAAHAKYYVKMTLLLGCWLFFTVVFLMYGEEKHHSMSTSVDSAETKRYFISTSSEVQSIRVKLSGPFIPEQELLNKTKLDHMKTVVVWIEKEQEDGAGKEKTPPWTVHLRDSDLNFNIGEARSSVLSFESPTSRSSNHTYAICITSTSEQTIPFRLSYLLNPLDVTTGVVYAFVLLIGLYVLIIFEVVNRTMAALVVSTLALATLALVGERPSLPEMISWLDLETIILLFSMMLLVALMAETGIYDFLAVFTFEITKGKLWPLIFVLCGITAVLSTFLDNVTTVLLMSPVTIRLCEVMELDPVRILVFMAIFSNIGATATPVGDPPNVIVASNRAVIDAGIHFTNFTAHMLPGALLAAVQTALQLRFMFRDTNTLRQSVPRDIQDLHNQISVWRRAAESLPHFSNDVHVVRERLEKKIRKLSVQLDTMVKRSSKRACPEETYRSTLSELKQKYKIRNKVLLAKASVTICFVVVLFFLHAMPELNRVSIGWTALLGAILLLLLADREDIEPILHRVEWTTLLFFAALFILMEALSKLGLISYLGDLMEQLILRVDQSSRLPVAILLIVWVSGITSAFVDNLPLATMMVRVVVAIGTNPALNLPMEPLIWSLLYGASLGGNGTLIGSSAAIVCAGVAEQHGYKFSVGRFFRVGFPVMLGNLVVASGYLMLCHCVFQWNL